jgi:ribokinase
MFDEANVKSATGMISAGTAAGLLFFPPLESYLIGSANVDLTTFSDRFPRPGETIFGQKFDLGFGGKGANQAVAARLCGADVVMVAKLGNDLFGEATVKNFASLGIDTSHVRIVDGVSSGVAPIFVEPNGQNRIIVVKGANDTLKPADVDAAAGALKKVDTIVLQFEIPMETIAYTIQFAKKNGIRCIVNPAPAQPINAAELSGADYFIPNETEAEVITGLPVHSIEEAKKCAGTLLQQGFRKVILTLGSRGALLASPQGSEVIAPFTVTPTDTTGAGDAFIGSFAVFLGAGLPEKEAVTRANLYAALSTTRVGTQKSFPTHAEFVAEWDKRGGKP